ncbi:MAG: DUF1549 domain-containing protein [Planctomycetaceae bacterium]|nr:DUF1549 domain-containing protein [Planctomycetaceae bacterium]
MKLFFSVFAGCILNCSLLTGQGFAEQTIPPINERYAESAEETPDFQRHLVPMLSKLGCNGRSCHGSFQGRGGFQLSLFGYDFEMDHKGLNERIDTQDPADSYALQKATNVDEHEGGEKIKPGSWEYRVFHKWIESGAAGAETPMKLARLEVTPAELVVQGADEQHQLNVVAVWENGTREDVTPLSRFQSNDTSIAEVSENGMITSRSPGDSHVIVFYDNGLFAVPVIQPVSQETARNYPEVPAPTAVDQHVITKLRKLGIVQSELSTDEEFLRRVSLDIAGTLPTPGEVRAFVEDSSPDKRSQVIERLLESPAYSAWWSTRLNDLTGNAVNQINNVSFSNTRVSKEWYEWIRKRVADNMPYDQLVEGIVLAKSQREDETYTEYCERMTKIYTDKTCEEFAEQDSLPYFWARRNFQTSEDRAIGFAYTFLGIRVQCAQCHKHPFDQWTQQDFTQFQPLFSRTRYSQNGTDASEYRAMLEELDLDKSLRGNQLRRELATLANKGKVVPFPALVDNAPRTSTKKGKDGKTLTPNQMARVLGGEPFNLNEYENPREPLMKWLRGDAQELFAKAFVNRVWANYFNRGIVEPTDDLSLANPPSNAALLDHLAQGFIEHNFDMKWVHREICNSRTYQLSWQANDTNRLDERNFSHAIPRRMPAEVAMDAIRQATASDEANESYLASLDSRAIAIPDSAQGRGGNNYALTIFGKSARENNCDCERSNEPTLLQTLYLNNDNEFLSAIDSKNGWLNQLADQWGEKQKAQAEQVAPRPENYAEVVERYEAYIKRLREQDDKAKLKEVKSKLTAYKAKYGQQDKNEEPEQPVVTEQQMQETVTTAYLRTLNRFPTEQELETGVEAIHASSSRVQGMRDLLWALLNTKEFIVNH